MRERIKYDNDTGGSIVSWLRYEYEGLNLLRIDQKYDSDQDEVLEGSDSWRPMNIYLHGPGAIGQIIKSKWFSYADDSTATPCTTGEYYYFYDAVGNVVGVWDQRDGAYQSWAMDAFGNPLSGVEFLAMDQPGPKEHLTGKMYDTVTGLYYFHLRWVDPEVGRFISRDPLQSQTFMGKPMAALFVYFPQINTTSYTFVNGNPVLLVDPSGELTILGGFGIGCAIGAGGEIIKWLTDAGSSWRELGCSCLGNGVAGAITMIMPSPASGCIGGAVGAVVERWCECGFPDSWSDLGETVVRAVLGCVWGYLGGLDLTPREEIKAALVGAFASFGVDTAIDDAKAFAGYDECCDDYSN